MEDIQAANSLSSVLIRPGDVLIIPIERDGDSAPVSQVASQFEYTVQAGDTVVSMATRFGSTVQDILQANGLSRQRAHPARATCWSCRCDRCHRKVLASSSDVLPAPTPVVAGRPASAAEAETIYSRLG